MTAKTRVTVESITSNLERISEAAEGSKQYSAAKGAQETIAKLHGLLIDRKESGAPGDFQGDQTREAVLARLATELGDDVAALVAAKLAERDVESLN